MKVIVFLSLFLRLTIEPYLGFVSGKKCKINVGYKFIWGIWDVDHLNQNTKYIENFLNDSNNLQFFKNSSDYIGFDHILDEKAYVVMLYNDVDGTDKYIRRKLKVKNKTDPSNLHLKYEIPCGVLQIIECQSFDSHYLPYLERSCSLLPIMVHDNINYVGHIYITRLSGQMNFELSHLLNYSWVSEEYYFPKIINDDSNLLIISKVYAHGEYNFILHCNQLLEDDLLYRDDEVEILYRPFIPTSHRNNVDLTIVYYGHNIPCCEEIGFEELIVTSTGNKTRVLTSSSSRGKVVGSVGHLRRVTLAIPDCYMPVRFTLYVNVLEKEVKPTKFRKYLVASKIIDDLSDVDFEGTLGQHSIEVFSSFRPKIYYQNYTIVFFFSYGLSNDNFICILSSKRPSCEPKELHVLEDRAYFSDRVEFDAVYLFFHNDKTYRFKYSYYSTEINVPHTPDYNDGIIDIHFYLHMEADEVAALRIPTKVTEMNDIIYKEINVTAI